MKETNTASQTIETSNVGTTKVTNHDVLKAIFHTLPANAHIAVCSKSGDPTQGGWSATKFEAKQRFDLNRNQYFNCATFKLNDKGNISAKKEYFAGLHAIVLDDVGSKIPVEKLGELKVSAKIETSPGNYQVILILDQPIVDIAEATAFQKRFIDAGLCDTGASGTCRWARLPQGINGKNKYKVDDKPFQCSLVEWQPEVRHSVATLEDVLVVTELPVQANQQKALADEIAKQCSQIRLFRDSKGKGQSEPLWFACLGIVGHCEYGQYIAQDWSSGYEQYNYAETHEKLTHRLQMPPTTCNQFKTLNPGGCSSCELNVTSPIILGKQSLVKNKISENIVQKTFLEDVKPWQDPVDPAALLSEIMQLVMEYIVLDENQALTCALWIMLTWLSDHVDLLPLLLINAPEHSCGKTQLITFIAELVYRGIPTSNITPAAMYRIIELNHPTLIIDEADTFLKEGNDLTNIINSGYTRSSAFVIRSSGESHEPKMFSTWGPKLLGGIALENHLKTSTYSRCIEIKMRRKMAHEEVKRLRHADKTIYPVLQQKLSRFSMDIAGSIRQTTTKLPEALNDRQQDNWEPLVSIASCISQHWLDETLDAATVMSVKDEIMSEGVTLLMDIRDSFAKKKTTKLSTADLIQALCQDEEALWSTYHRGIQEITPRQLAKLLNKYGIKSRTVRKQYETNKGYYLEDFKDAFTRYLPAESCDSHKPVEIEAETKTDDITSIVPLKPRELASKDAVAETPINETAPTEVPTELAENEEAF